MDVCVCVSWWWSVAVTELQRGEVGADSATAAVDGPSSWYVTSAFLDE